MSYVGKNRVVSPCTDLGSFHFHFDMPSSHLQSNSLKTSPPDLQSAHPISVRSRPAAGQQKGYAHSPLPCQNSSCSRRSKILFSIHSNARNLPDIWIGFTHMHGYLSRLSPSQVQSISPQGGLKAIFIPKAGPTVQPADMDHSRYKLNISPIPFPQHHFPRSFHQPIPLINIQSSVYPLLSSFLLPSHKL